jgi:hypothetical protein
MNINNIVAQQIKDLQPKPIPFIQPNVIPSMTGMQQRCYELGYSHAEAVAEPTPVLDGIDAMPCTWSATNNQAYTQGFIDRLGL